MSDAQARAALEAAQVAVQALERELADWPAVTKERAALLAEVRSLEEQVSLAQAATETALADERALRARVDSAQTGLRPRWYMSVFAPFAVVVALLASCLLSMRAVTGDGWWPFARHYGAWVALAPVAFNALRVLLSGPAWLKRRATRRFSP